MPSSGLCAFKYSAASAARGAPSPSTLLRMRGGTTLDTPADLRLAEVSVTLGLAMVFR